MSDIQTFPQTWQDFADDYTFNDYKEFYTNGIELIPLFRIEQMMGHYYDPVVAENRELRELALDMWFFINGRPSRSNLKERKAAFVDMHNRLCRMQPKLPKEFEED